MTAKLEDMSYDSTEDTKNHIARVADLLEMAADELRRRGRAHDKSKLEDPEKSMFDEYTPKLKGCTYGSEEYRSLLAGLKPALDSHYSRNSHHPEHYPWHCPVCKWQGDQKEYDTSPQGPNDSGVRYCPSCSRNGIIYETELERRPELGVSGMDLFDLVEMFFDWKASGERTKDGSIHRSIEVNRHRFCLDPQVASILSNTATRMGYL